jgi:hypothetical protein
MTPHMRRQLELIRLIQAGEGLRAATLIRQQEREDNIMALAPPPIPVREPPLPPPIHPTHLTPQTSEYESSYSSALTTPSDSYDRTPLTSDNDSGSPLPRYYEPRGSSPEPTARETPYKRNPPPPPPPVLRSGPFVWRQNPLPPPPPIPPPPPPPPPPPRLPRPTDISTHSEIEAWLDQEVPGRHHYPPPPSMLGGPSYQRPSHPTSLPLPPLIQQQRLPPSVRVQQNISQIEDEFYVPPYDEWSSDSQRTYQRTGRVPTHYFSPAHLERFRNLTPAQFRALMDELGSSVQSYSSTPEDEEEEDSKDSS